MTFGASFSPFAFTTQCDGETYRHSKLFWALFCSYLFLFSCCTWATRIKTAFTEDVSHCSVTFLAFVYECDNFAFDNYKNSCARVCQWLLRAPLFTISLSASLIASEFRHKFFFSSGCVLWRRIFVIFFSLKTLVAKFGMRLIKDRSTYLHLSCQKRGMTELKCIWLVILTGECPKIISSPTPDYSLIC